MIIIEPFLIAQYFNKKSMLYICCFLTCFSFGFTFHVLFMFLYFSLLVETKPRLTKETAFVLGMFYFLRFLFDLFVVCFAYFAYFFSLISKGEQKKSALGRTLDVYGLQELSDEPDPHATLPFISHHTLNLTRDLNDSDSNPNKTNKTRELSNTNILNMYIFICEKLSTIIISWL